MRPSRKVFAALCHLIISSKDTIHSFTEHNTATIAAQKTFTYVNSSLIRQHTVNQSLFVRIEFSKACYLVTQPYIHSKLLSANNSVLENSTSPPLFNKRMHTCRPKARPQGIMQPSCGLNQASPNLNYTQESVRTSQRTNNASTTKDQSIKFILGKWSLFKARIT